MAGPTADRREVCNLASAVQLRGDFLVQGSSLGIDGGREFTDRGPELVESSETFLRRGGPLDFG